MLNPLHVAIIMDGNGRWAKKKGLACIAGHQAGAGALRETVMTARDFGISWLTVYAFSSENWSRPPLEINDLMRLLGIFIQENLKDIQKAGIKVRIIGDRETLGQHIKSLLKKTEKLTALNTEMNLVVAFNYGGRDEIVRAVRQITQEALEGKITPEEVSTDILSQNMYTWGIPDPDLVIRTSGEMRLSNFLMWQIAYSELVFLPCLWPDFNRHEFSKAIQIFRERKRRFGGRVPEDLQS